MKKTKKFVKKNDHIPKHMCFGIQKRPITLLEVLIAMSLMSILIVALMGFYSQMETIHQEIAKQRKNTFYKVYLQSRLGSVIPYAKMDQNKGPWFYSTYEGEQPSLVFVYDNHVDVNPNFSNLVLGKLYVDRQNRLTLATWPVPEKDFSQAPPMRKEILYENVKNLSFLFFQPPRREVQKGEIVKTGEVNGWLSSWDFTKEQIPPIVKILIETIDENLIPLAYVMPNSKDAVFYP